VGIWIHDTDYNDFGRQTNTFSYGARFILEDCTMGGSARSLIDCEPTTAHVPAGVEVPAGVVLDSVVSDLHVLDCTFGHNNGGIGLHAGVTKVHIAGNDGYRPGLPSLCFAEQVIFENNHDTTTSTDGVASYGCRFGRILAADVNNAIGQDFGGLDLIVRNNVLIAHLAAAKFEAGCDRYFSTANTVTDTNGQPRGNVPSGDDPSVNAPSFTLPVPAHALRDL
jgi:hypothetical protein